MLIALLASFALAQPTPGSSGFVEEPVFVDPALQEEPLLEWPADAPFAPAEVELLLVLDETGAVQEAQLLAGPEPFAALALAHAVELRFSPATADGVPEAVEVPFRWSFVPPWAAVRGQVFDPSGLPVPGVVVRVGDQEVRTDAEGGFEVAQLLPGAYLLTANQEGFQEASLSFSVGQRQELALAVELREPVGGDVALGTYRRPQYSSNVRVIGASEIRTTPGTLGDPVRVVQNMPGLTRTPLDSGWLLVRGGDPGDTGLYIDGVRVPLIYHLGGFTSVIHPLLVEDVRFMPGGVGARYGQATGGAVEIRTRPAETMQARVGADLLYANAYVEAPLGEKSGIALAARRSYLDRVLSVVLSEEQAAIAPRFWDLTGRVDSPHFGLTVLAFQDSVDVPINAEGDTAIVSIATRRAHGRARAKLGGGELSNLLVLATDTRTVVYTGVDDRREQTQLSLRSEWTGAVAEEARLNAGVEGTLTDYTIRVGDRSANAVFGNLDPYAELRLGDARWISLGFRLETLKIEEQLWDLTPSPRLAGELPLGERLVVRADAGLYTQPPPIEWRVGLPAGWVLRPELALGQSVGLRWTNHPFELTLDAYGRKLDRVTLIEADGTLGQGQGLAYGLEGMGRWAVGPLNGWLALTWSRSLRREEPGHLYEPSLYDQPLLLVNVVGYDLGHDLNLSTRFRIGSGYPWDGKTEDLYDLLTLTAQPIYADEKGRLRPYHALDVKLAWDHAGRRVQSQVYLDVQNVYFRRVEEPIITGIDDRETVYALGLPILPILGFQLGWRRG